MIARRNSALAALAVLGLAACTSEPSTRTVAEEIVETLESVPQDVKDCMTERLEGYSDDDLEAIGDANPNFRSTGATVETTPELDEFIADLADCTGTTETDSTATDDTASEGTTSGEPSDDTTAATATTEG